VRTLLQMRGDMQETLMGFKRDMLVQHKVKSTALATELAALAERKAELNKQAAQAAGSVSEVEASVRSIERELAELSKQGVIDKDGTVNVTLTRKKKRLDRDMDAALVKISDRRATMSDLQHKVAELEEERLEKEEALRSVEAALVGTLVQQQRQLMTVLASVRISGGGGDDDDDDVHGPDGGSPQLVDDEGAGGDAERWRGGSPVDAQGGDGDGNLGSGSGGDSSSLRGDGPLPVQARAGRPTADEPAGSSRVPTMGDAPGVRFPGPTGGRPRPGGSDTAAAAAADSFAAPTEARAAVAVQDGDGGLTAGSAGEGAAGKTWAGGAPFQQQLPQPGAAGTAAPSGGAGGGLGRSVFWGRK
jgi:hypothetical protein